MKNRPKFGSKLMDISLKQEYRNAWNMTAEEYNSELLKPRVIWKKDNYTQRKQWLELHIKKNS
jgi:molybdopterin synthase catalytic subunit